MLSHVKGVRQNRVSMALAANAVDRKSSCSNAEPERENVWGVFSPSLRAPRGVQAAPRGPAVPALRSSLGVPLVRWGRGLPWTPWGRAAPRPPCAREVPTRRSEWSGMKAAANIRRRWRRRQMRERARTLGMRSSQRNLQPNRNRGINEKDKILSFW